MAETARHSTRPAMSRRGAAMLLAAASLAVLAPATPWAASPPASVAEAEQVWYDALVAADGPRLEALLAGDFAYQHPTGNTYGKAAFIVQFTSGNVTVSKLGPVERHVRDYGATVVVYGANAIEGRLGGQPYAGTIRFVNIWRNQQGGWQLVHRHSQIQAP